MTSRLPGTSTGTTTAGISIRSIGGRTRRTCSRSTGTTRRRCRAGDFELTTRPTDFLGINFYTRHVIAAGRSLTEPRYVLDGFAPRTDMNWEVYPQGLRDLLVRVRDDYAPPAIHITENGAAYTDVQRHDGSVPDPDRVAYLEGHVEAMAQSIEDGVPLTAYYVWSLLDNFEWALGYARRFGIVYVDYATLERTPKASFEYYRALIAAQRSGDAVATR